MNKYLSGGRKMQIQLKKAEGIVRHEEFSERNVWFNTVPACEENVN